MVIEPVVVDLRKTLDTMSSGAKKKFLDAFGKVHMRWHMTRTFKGSPIGFLSFHHEVVTVYVNKYAPQLAPGPMANPNPPYPAWIDSLTETVQFSNSLEGWHNTVHRTIGGAFADPTKNIYMKRFWQFHKFIDEKFQNWLQARNTTYDDVDHTEV